MASAALLFPFSTFPVLIHLKSVYFSFSVFSIFFLNSWASKSVRWCCEPGCNLATLDLILSGKQGRLVFTSASASLLPYFFPPFSMCIRQNKSSVLAGRRRQQSLQVAVNILQRDKCGTFRSDLNWWAWSKTRLIEVENAEWQHFKPIFKITSWIPLAKQAGCAPYARCCESKLLMALWWEGGGEKESTTLLTTNLVGRVNSVTTSSDQHRNPFTDGTSNYPRLVFEVSRKGTERKPQGGQFALHAHYTSGD